MANKKTIMTASTIRTKSESAVGIIRRLIDQLKSTNEDAEVLMTDNAAKITAIKQENAGLETLKAQNEKIVKNFENLLGYVEL